jgi:hypothetical protein
LVNGFFNIIYNEIDLYNFNNKIEYNTILNYNLKWYYISEKIQIFKNKHFLNFLLNSNGGNNIYNLFFYNNNTKINFVFNSVKKLNENNI